MHDPIFRSAMTNVEALLRAAARAGEAGDAGAVSAELVRAALTLGVQIGSLQARYAGSYDSTPQAKVIQKALRGLQTTAVKAFARVEEVSDQAGLPQIEEPIGPTMEYETPYHEDGENEYVP